MRAPGCLRCRRDGNFRISLSEFLSLDWRSALWKLLTTLVVVLIVSMFVPQIASFGIVQWGSATIFALYIGYEIARRASDIPANARQRCRRCLVALPGCH